MSRHLIVLNTDADRFRLCRYIDAAPTGTRVEFKAAKRTIPQNDRMWAMLTDIALQKEHCGRKYTPDIWKVLFMHACGREVQFLPSLDGQTFIPWGHHSSDLSKGEMADLITFMLSWGSQNGVQFHDPEGLALEAMASERLGAVAGKPSTPRVATEGADENTRRGRAP